MTKGFVDHHKIITIINEKLKELGITQPVTRIVEVSRFEYPESGKLRRFLPFVKF